MSDNSLFKIGGLVALLVVLLLGGCVTTRYVSPDAGFEAVLVKKPYFFGHGGIVNQPVSTGATLVARSTDDIMVYMQPKQYEVKFDDLMSRDGIPLHFDSVIRLQVTDSVDLIKRFGPNWYGNNIESEFRNRVRNSVKKHGMNETAISTVAIDEIDAEVTGALNKYIEITKMPVRLIKVTVGKASPPDAIKTQRIKTAQEQQRQITEGETQKAEITRKTAEAARADADNAYRTQMGLNPEQFVQLQQIEMTKQVCGQPKSKCTFVAQGVSAIVNSR